MPAWKLSRSAKSDTVDILLKALLEVSLRTGGRGRGGYWLSIVDAGEGAGSGGYHMVPSRADERVSVLESRSLVLARYERVRGTEGESLETRFEEEGWLQSAAWRDGRWATKRGNKSRLAPW